MARRNREYGPRCNLLIGVILKSYKTYQTLSYIPFSHAANFTAFVGINGAGKSSVLEALDSFFNGAEWNIHFQALSKGLTNREPVVCPIFLLKKSDYQNLKHNWLAENLSRLLWESSLTDYNASVRSVASAFLDHRDKIIREGASSETHYLVPLGFMKSNILSITKTLSIFESHNGFGVLRKYPTYADELNRLFNSVTDEVTYIYIPAEIDYHEYTRIEGMTVQSLLGQKLDEIVRSFVKQDTVKEINSHLGEFLDQIALKLQSYTYKKPAKKQALVNRTHLTAKIIEAYFDSRVLHKGVGKDLIPVGNLSSGEKRQALIDIAKAFLSVSDVEIKRVTILAVDEPEMSLHISSAHKQFENLKEIARSGSQVIITTHWYGFMPIVSEGHAVHCLKGDNFPRLIDLRCFREEIRKIVVSTKNNPPIELELKGTSDLIHSITASIVNSDYRWVICEGASDKIYLDHYLDGSKVNVIAVGGAAAVKQIYSQMEMTLHDLRGSINGRVVFVIDTDKTFESFLASERVRQLKICRISNNINTKKSTLLPTSDTRAYPPTAIEDVLVYRGYIDAMEKLAEHEVAVRELLSGTNLPAVTSDNMLWPSYISMNLGVIERECVDSMFNAQGFKVRFALEYCRHAKKNARPEFINELIALLYGAQ